jgi:hypothetical protein
MKNWYVGNTSNHQGLIADENTGKNIAVAYDKADAPLIAAAPKLLMALKMSEERWRLWADYYAQTDEWDDDDEAACRAIEDAITEAEGRS